MKKNTFSPTLSLFIVFLLLPLAAFAQGVEPTQDKTLSPFFFVQSDDPGLDALPLKSTSAEVKIAGVIADVTVIQEYKNEGKKPIEAIYIFPASTKAAVYAMKMTIGERTIEAKIEEKKKAREQYEQAKREGKSASLLEQQRPNVFQMNVANIMPGDLIKVEMKYTELLVPTDGVYEFVYPTVVGPRYSNTPEAKATDNEKWVKNPYLHEKESPSYAFHIGVMLSAGLPIQEVASPSHNVDIAYQGPAIAKISLPDGEKNRGNKDFVLRYVLAGNKVESGLLLYPGETENFFLLMMEPPKRPTVDQIPPREYIFVLDVSGSMHGFPLDTAKKVMEKLLGAMRPTDFFNIMYFSGGSNVLAEKSLPATPENVQMALHTTNMQSGGGGTEILDAMKRSLALPRADGTSRTVVVVTDGYVSVEVETFELIRASLGQANLFAFGIGSSVNRFIIEGMARAGLGEPFIVLSPEEAATKAEKFRKYIETPVLTQIKLEYQGLDTYDIEPAGIPDVFAERPVIVFGKYKGKAAGKITLTGFSGKDKYRKENPVEAKFASVDNSALRYLWARHRIATLADLNQLAPNDARVQEVTKLGLNYNLMTAYTSFVAIDSEVRNVGGKQDSVKQPLPLPEGVSNLAVGEMAASGRGAANYAPMKMMRLAESAPAVNEEMERRRSSMAMASAPAMDEGDIAPEPQEMKKEALTTPSPKPADKLQASGMSITGLQVPAGINAAEYQKILDLAQATLLACKQAYPQLTGDMNFALTIDKNGKVKQVELLKKPADSTWKKILSCLIRQLKALKFGPSAAGEVKVSFTLRFS